MPYSPISVTEGPVYSVSATLIGLMLVLSTHISNNTVPGKGSHSYYHIKQSHGTRLQHFLFCIWYLFLPQGLELIEKKIRNDLLINLCKEDKKKKELLMIKESKRKSIFIELFCARHCARAFIV